MPSLSSASQRSSRGVEVSIFVRSILTCFPVERNRGCIDVDLVFDSDQVEPDLLDLSGLLPGGSITTHLLQVIPARLVVERSSASGVPEDAPRFISRIRALL